MQIIVLRRDMHSILKSRPVSTPTFVVFAKEDPVSQPAHLPVTWVGNIVVTTVPSTHQFVAAQPETWTAIKSWVNTFDVVPKGGSGS